MTYQVLRKLSEGGFSEVFEVLDPASAIAETLVLKRLSTEMSARQDVCRAFTQEGQILADLRHPNVVPFRRCFFEDGHICLVMEKVEGDLFADWIQESRRNPTRVLDVFRQVLEAVDYLHRRPRPLLHLDLKPENVLVRPIAGGSQPVLIDFGIARNVGSHGLKAYTPPYAAPEQQTGKQLGCYTDVFALGQILAEVLKVLGDAVPPHETPALEAVSRKARARSRGRRFADAGDMLRAFRAARGTSIATTTQSPKTFVAMAGAATLVLVGTAILLLLHLVDKRPKVAHQRSAAKDVYSRADVTSTTPSAVLLDACSPFSPPDGNLATVLETLRLCEAKAMNSNDIQVMNDYYLSAKTYLEDHEHSDATRGVIEENVAAFKQKLETITRTRR